MQNSINLFKRKLKKMTRIDLIVRYKITCFIDYKTDMRNRKPHFTTFCFIR